MNEAPKKLMIESLRKVLKRLHGPIEVMLACVHWYAAYPLSLRHIEEVMSERGVVVDHATVHRWAFKMLPVLAAVFRKRKKPVGSGWRMDERTSRWPANGSIYTAPLIVMATPSTSCLQHIETLLLRDDSSNEPSTCMARRRG